MTHALIKLLMFAMMLASAPVFAVLAGGLMFVVVLNAAVEYLTRRTA